MDAFNEIVLKLTEMQGGLNLPFYKQRIFFLQSHMQYAIFPSPSQNKSIEQNGTHFILEKGTKDKNAWEFSLKLGDYVVVCISMRRR